MMNAFQDSGSKESILKVESTGEGELDELIEDFSEGRIQFAFVKVKDPNSGLPKNVFIAWCGGGVPERTKGYFTSHSNAVSKVLHGYHVQITARSDSDLAPEAIMKKVSDASGAKYTAGGSAPMSSGTPPVAKKPVFMPTSSGSAVNPLVAARNRKQENVDDDGWGADAPPVSRSEIQKVESAYKPTKVDMAALTGQKQEPSRYNGGSRQAAPQSDNIGGSYQPVGKVDIAAIRAAAKEKNDDRPTIVKGAYEPVGKVDIAAIRAKAQKPADAAPKPEPEPEEKPKSLADRSAAFSQPQSERMTSMPKPKVASKFGGASSFTGTKPLTPGAFGLGTGPTNVAAAAPVGAASRTFADQGGKTPAQLWAEKKAAQGGGSGASSQPVTSPVTAQKSGSEWKSGYEGKKWGSVETGSSAFGRSGGVVEQKTGDDAPAREQQPEEPSSGGGVSAMRDMFKGSAPMGQAAPQVPRTVTGDRDEPSAPPIPGVSSRPSGGFQLPGLPDRGIPKDEEEEEEVATPPVPQREESPARIAVPVPRGPEPTIEPADPIPPRPVPVPAIEKELPEEDELPEEPAGKDPARGAAAAVAEQSFGRDAVEETQTASEGGKRALVQYDYEKAEDNELELREGEYVTDIEMVDEDWWMGTNAKGESGLFPSNYVELVEDSSAAAAVAGRAAPPPPAPAAAEPEAAAPAGEGKTATAQYDYEAAEDNELGFPEGAKITNLEFPDDDWWFGHYKGQSGLFPSNYVELNN